MPRLAIAYCEQCTMKCTMKFCNKLELKLELELELGGYYLVVRRYQFYVGVVRTISHE